MANVVRSGVKYDFRKVMHTLYLFFAETSANELKDFVLSVCVCVLSSILQGSLVHPSRRLGYVSPAPHAIPKDLVIIHSRDSTWGDLFRGPPFPPRAQRL